jgi:fatty-acyl-CoA synthase
MPLTHPAADVWTLLADVADATPDAPAFIHGERRLSFAELLDCSARAAQGLSDLGVGPGDRVALWLPNIPAYPILYFACARLGAIAVAVNTRYRAVEVADIVGRSGAKVLACAPAFRRIDFLSILAGIEPDALDRLSAIVTVGETPEPVPPAIEHRRRVPFDRLLSRPRFAGNHASARAPCNIFTTSGTTSSPKFVLHRQGAIAGHAQQVARTFGFTAPETLSLAILPMCGVFGFNQTLATLAAGKPSVLVESYEIEEIARLITQHKPTTMFGSDDMYQRLLELMPGRWPFKSIKWAGYAAFNASLEDLPERAQPRGLRLVGLYGMSEVQALFASQSPAAPAADRARGGGTPVSPQARVRVRDLDTGKILSDGEHGEIEAKGPSLMAGYADDAAATAAAFTEDGYLRTGDLGYTVPGGFVFLARMGDALRLGGYLVNPVEISSHIEAHPAVAACQVVGAKTRRGERAVAFVVKRAGAVAEEGALIAHCRAGLASFKCPEAVIFLDAFPVAESANGVKIQRAKLRDLARERVGRE